MVTRHDNALCGFHRALRGCVLLWHRNPVTGDLEHKWRMLIDRHLPFKADSIAVFDLVRQLTLSPDELEKRIVQEYRKRNAPFFRNLSDAMKKKTAYRRYTVTVTTLLTFRELYRKLRHRPGREQLKERVEQKWGEKISDRQWRRTFNDDGIESLFSAVA
jgi:hypothetical protein